MKAIFTVGCSGSGKSTWAKNMQKDNEDIFISNRDDLRFIIAGKEGWQDYKFNRKTEDKITTFQRESITNCASVNRDVIIADTNLNKRFREDLIKFCTDLGFEIEIKEFPMTLEELWKRDQYRGVYSVGREILYKQWQMWLEYSNRHKHIRHPYLPNAVIFDIDGTLAHMVDSKPYDWDKVGSDVLDPLVFQTYQSMNRYPNNDVHIIIMSGRDSICRNETEHWLYKNDIHYSELHMRAENDMRKDTIVKEELFFNNIEGNYNVIAVFDDRPCVVRMWHDIGIPKVFAVGNQNIEF